MAADSAQERTEQATPKKRRDARRKGQVASSREVPSVLILLAVLGAFYLSGDGMLRRMTAFMRGHIPEISATPLDIAALRTLLAGAAEVALSLVLPIFAVVLFAGLAANLAQVGFHLTSQPLAPNFSKINPVNGLKRFVSLKSLMELFKSITKIGIIGGVAFVVLSGETASIPGLMGMGVVDILAFLGRVAQKIAFFVALVLILLAAVDYLYQRWQFEKDLRMSKQEIKEEFKQREGDPMIRARIRRIQSEMARHRMMEAVPDADVVITNPTHFAVALKYDPGEMSAPKVVAKGAGYVAQRIRETAARADVPVIENKPLARTLFKTVEIDQAIPADLYRAVAEILAYVYNLKKRPR